MIAPPYPIPSTRRYSNYELTRYVRCEFNDNECHWFSISMRARVAKKTPDSHKASLLRRLFAPKHVRTPEIGPGIVPCAVLLDQRCEDDNGLVKVRRH